MFSDVLKSSAGHSSYFYRRVTASCLFTNASLRCFFKKISRVIAVSLHASYYFKGLKKIYPVLNVHLLKLFSTPTRTYSHLSPLLEFIIHPPPCGQPPPFPLETISPILAVNFHPNLAVIFHHPPCGRPPPFPLDAISPILAVNFYPSCRSNS